MTNYGKFFVNMSFRHVAAVIDRASLPIFPMLVFAIGNESALLAVRHPRIRSAQKCDKAVHDQQKRDHKDQEKGRSIRNRMIQKPPKIFLKARRHLEPLRSWQTKPERILCARRRNDTRALRLISASTTNEAPAVIGQKAAPAVRATGQGLRSRAHD